MRVKVKNIPGNGKLSVKANGDWLPPVAFNGDGVYEKRFTGALNTINTGANNDSSFIADFEFLSLRLADSEPPQALLTDDNGAVLVDDWGRVLTADIT